MPAIADRLAQIRDRVAQAASRSGREVELLVVSKTWAAETVSEVVAQGQRLFGENRLQEGEEKIPVLPDELEWHFIGTLQRNKVRKVLQLFSVIHSISSLKLAAYTNRIAGELGLRPKVYLEVNIGIEEGKHGFHADDLRIQLDEVLAMPNLSVQGLMCIPPRGESPEESRPWFTRVKLLQEELEQQTGQVFAGLSMGMSGDYEIAIEEGSTIVRVGSAIFGPRR
jgi:pyridoxal phosphate enzyme (YggS family)